MEDNIICVEFNFEIVNVVNLIRQKEEFKICSYKTLYNDENLVFNIKEYIKENSIHTKKAVITINDKDIYTKIIKIKDLNKKEILNLLRCEFKNEVDLKSSQLDYTIMENSNEKYVLGAITSKDKITHILYILKMLKLKPILLTINLYSLVNIINLKCKLNGRDIFENACFINVSSIHISVSLIKNNILIFTKNLVKDCNIYINLENILNKCAFDFNIYPSKVYIYGFIEKLESEHLKELFKNKLEYVQSINDIEVFGKYINNIGAIL